MSRRSAACLAAIAERVERVETALEPYVDAGDTEAGKAVAVRDLLADIRHFCDANEIDFAEEDRKGYAHYRAELAGEL